MSVRITLGKSRLVTLTPTDANGNATVLDGQIIWTTSDSDVVSVQPVADSNGLSAYIVSTGVGLAYVSASGDADLDPNEERIIAFEADFDVTLPEAIELVGEIGEEVDSPTPVVEDPAVDAAVPVEG